MWHIVSLGKLPGLQSYCPHQDNLLQDHPAVLSAFYLKEEAGPIAITDELLHSSGRIRLRAIAKYLLFRKGPLTTTGCDHGAFVSTRGGPCFQSEAAERQTQRPR